jgi:glycogen operon protein
MLPLGAHWDGRHTHFIVTSANASFVEVCVYSASDPATEIARTRLHRHGDRWMGRVDGIGPGTRYALRAGGPWQPADGHWFAPDLWLFDPYARAVGRPLDWTTRQSPLGAIINSAFDWRDDRRPGTPWADTVIYEAHVKGFTARHPDIPEDIRGTYAGLASPPAIAHLQRLGITAVELLPVHARVDERALVDRGLTNYWGYNTLGYFAPEPRLAAARTPQGVVDEFKTMVRTLHAAGIEVLLDVVYNHTAEGNHSGPTLSLRGLDNTAYYRLRRDDPARYEDLTGCGNTLDMRLPHARQLVLDSLRYWATEMHVDGFRFDLASALARNNHDHVDTSAPLLTAIAADPVLSRVKLIAEPWDATTSGYAVGRFPAGWAEWNGRYRDDVRRYWRGDGSRSALATRLAGSSDLYDTPGRGPTASINFVTSHDGFTLADLVTYAHKHNDANGEGNRDGDNHNLSDNMGVEGPTTDHSIVAARAQRQRALFATLLASVGVPMISGGDEMGRTQSGNNNAYCHDSPLSWTPWTTADGADLDLLGTVERLSAWRRSMAAVRRTTFFGTHDIEVSWLRLDGSPLRDDDWRSDDDRGFIMRLHGAPAVDVVIDGAEVRIETRPTSETPPQED